jgi:hypothetical protein
MVENEVQVLVRLGYWKVKLGWEEMGGISRRQRGKVRKKTKTVAVARPMPEDVPIMTMTYGGVWVWRCRFWEEP